MGNEQTNTLFVSIINDKIRIFTLILSVLAIVLSQIRPIYQLFEKPEIETTVDIESLGITHYFGYLIFEQLLQIKNSGKASGIVSGIDYYIEKIYRDEDNISNDKKFRKICKVQTYRYGDNFSSQYPILDLFFDYGSIFNNPVVVYETLEKSKQDECKNLKKEIFNSIKNQHDKDYLSEERPFKYYVISDTLENKVKKLIDENLNGFTYGEYNLLVVTYNKNKQLMIPTKYYTFVIQKTDIDKLDEITNDYKFGGNNINYYNTDKEVGFYTRLTMNTDKIIINRLVENLKKIKNL